MKKICNAIYLTGIAAVIPFCGGCASSGPVTAQKVCAGFTEYSEAAAKLSAREEAMSSFRANGRTVAKFYRDGKRSRESFSIRLWFDRQGLLRLHGDVLFNSRGIDAGTNHDQFWMAL